VIKMVTDEYTQKWIKAIKESKTDISIAECINKIYEEGFSDGHNEAQTEADKEPDKFFVDRD